MTINNSKLVYIKNIFSGTSAFILKFFIAFLSVPISLAYWGNSIYGTIAVINSIVGYINLSGFGLLEVGNVYITHHNDYNGKKKLFHRLFTLSIVIILFMLFVFFFNSEIIIKNISNFLNLTTNNNQLNTLIGITIVFTLINIPLTLNESIFISINKQYLIKVRDSILFIINFIILLIVVKFNLSIINYFVYLNMVRLMFNSILLLFAYLKLKRLRNEVVENTNENLLSNKEIITLGFQYLLMSIGWLMFWNTDNIIISKFLGVELVTNYSIYFKVFLMYFTIIRLINGSLMSIVGGKYSIKDWTSLKKIYVLFLDVNIILGIAMFIVANFLLEDFIFHLTRNAFYIDKNIIIILSLYSILFSISSLNFLFIKMLDCIKNVFIVIWIQGIVNIILSLLFINVFGLLGVALGTLISSLISFSFYYYILNKRLKYFKIKINKMQILYLTLCICLSCLVSSIDCRLNYKIIITILILSLSTFIYLNYNKDLKKILIENIKNFIITKHNITK